VTDRNLQTFACGRGVGVKILTNITAVLAAVTSLVFCQFSLAQQPSTRNVNNSGTVCVMPNPAERPTRILAGGDYNPDTLTVRIDEREPVRWPHKKPLRIEGLSLEERHLVVLTSDGTRVHSFRFKFVEADGERLCMAFDGYQGVQLMNEKAALWCKCK
jgi:hypothetical protein